MRRLLLLYDDLLSVGGAERLFLEEEHYFRSRGYDVTTVVFQLNRSALFEYHPEKLLCLGARNHFVRLVWLVWLIWRLRPDYVIAPSNSEAIYLFLASWLAPVRYAVHVHGSLFWFETDKLKYAWLHRTCFSQIRNSLFGHREFIAAAPRLTVLQRLAIESLAFLDYFAIRRARSLIALTNQVAWEIEMLYGKRARVSRGCLSREWLELGRKSEGARLRDATLPRVIFSVGRLDPRKRIDVLLQAFALIVGDRPELRLVIGGIGPDSQRLHSLAASLNIQEKVEFCGLIPDCDLPTRYLDAEVFAFPSWTTSGITPYEALAFGCKVVWTTEAEEPVLNLPGVHVAHPTPDDFSRGLISALEDPSWPPIDEIEKYSWDQYFKGVEGIVLQGFRSSENSPASVAIPGSQTLPTDRG